ncbi:MAG: hypothetical protein C4341_02675 [Armatimonadota bacterium]
MLFRRPAVETVLLMALGLADLASTVVLYRLGLIVELNPVMRPLLERSLVLFTVVKLLSLAAAFVTLQLYRARDEDFCRVAAKWGAIAYAAVWLVWFTVGNTM